MSMPNQQEAVPSGPNRGSGTYRPRPAGWVVGMEMFAALAMIMVGFFHLVAGLAALFQNDVYVVGPRYVFSFDVTVWGWIHLLIGVLLLAAGFALRTGRVWARSVGIGFLALSMLANFLFVPYYPVWSLLIIVLDFFAIWALCVFTGYEARD